MKKTNKEIFIFYNLLAFCCLLLGFSSTIYLIQGYVFNPFKISVGFILILTAILLVVNYYYFGKKVQKLFEKSF